MSEAAREAQNSVFGERFDGRVPCPWCESSDTRVVSPFGGTVSEILFTCETCQQGFGFMKWDDRFLEDI